MLPPSDTNAIPPPLAGIEAQPFQFHGQASEYFRIWTVNTLLTFLTLGVFFPWAKVRKRRYLRGCTELMGHRFDYRANPVGLLIGHALVVTLFLGYSVFGAVYPVVRWGTLAAVVALLPWIVVRSFAFNAHNTVYRGLRFRFNPSLSAAFSVYLLQWLLIVLTLGFYYPAWARAKRHYIVSNHRLGSAYFRFDGATAPFFRAMFFGGGILAAASFLGAALMGMITAGNGGTTPGLMALAPFFALYGLGLFTSRHYIHAELFNHIWNHTSLDGHRFNARMTTRRWLGLQFTNLGAILVSGGLLYPWALMRAHQFTASCLSLIPAGSIDTIERVGGGRGSATGDSAAELVGLDFGL